MDSPLALTPADPSESGEIKRLLRTQIDAARNGHGRPGQEVSTDCAIERIGTSRLAVAGLKIVDGRIALRRDVN